MEFTRSMRITFRRVSCSALTVIVLFLLFSRYAFEFLGPESWLKYYIEHGWNPQAYNDLASNVYTDFFPLAFAVIVASDQIRDHRSRFASILRASAASKRKLFLGRVVTYIIIGFAVTFAALYFGLAVYCFGTGFAFPKKYSFIKVASRLFVHYISYSAIMVPFYTAFAIFFTSLFKSALAGIIASVIYITLKIINFNMPIEHWSATGFNIAESYIPFARYFYPIHGVPDGIASYLYTVDHVEAGGVISLKYIIIPYLCVLPVAVLLLILGYQLEKRFD